jgi:hypothetical protein
MSQVLLINPRKRGRKSAKRRKAPSAAQRANWARFAAMARRKSASGRARNPIKAHKRRRVARRRNPIISYARRRSARRRNPTGRSMGGGLMNFRSYITPIKDAAVMGAGAVAVDMAFGYVNRYLPVSMQVVPGAVGAGDAVKAVLTVALGKLLSGPTRGLSQKAAMGSLVVQMRDITMKVLPASVTGMGFYNPGRVVPSSVRVTGNTRAISAGQGASGGVGMYTQGASPLLGSPGLRMYTGAPSPLLSGRGAVRR